MIRPARRSLPLLLLSLLLLLGCDGGGGAGMDAGSRRDSGTHGDDGGRPPDSGGGGRDAQVTGPIAIEGPTLADGEDWSLPASATPNAYGGMFTMGDRSTLDFVRHDGATVYWADLNPADGVYDFSEVESLLAGVRAAGRGLILRLKGIVTWRDSPWGDPGPFVPAWVLAECDPPRFLTDPNIEVAAPWDACLAGHYLRFVEAFGEAGLLDDPALMGLYVHGISSSWGEEFWLEPDVIGDAEAAGMTQESLERAYSDRLNAWATAAGSERRKLVWVEAGWIEGYEAVRDRLNDLAWDLGMGTRGGGLEVFHRYTGPTHGVSVDADGHMHIDPSWPVRAEDRFFGDEIEIWDDVPSAAFPTSYRASVIRAVQLGMNFLWVEQEHTAMAPEISRWFTYVGGRSPGEALDAVVWLREGYVARGGGDFTLHNFEHLLEQRELEGARTAPAARVSRNSLFTDQGGMAFDYTARSTQRSMGQDGFALFLSPSFRGSLEGPVEVKVTYLDEGDAIWGIEAAGDGDPVASEPVTVAGGGGWRTATFRLSRAPREGALEGGADLRIRVTGGGDLTVRYVRVVRN